MSFPSIPPASHPLPNKSFSNNHVFLSLGNKGNLRLQNQGQNNFAQWAYVQGTSLNSTGLDFHLEMTVFLQSTFTSGSSQGSSLWRDNKYTPFCSQSPRKASSSPMDQHHFFFIALFPSPFLGFPFPRSFFRRTCSSLKCWGSSLDVSFLYHVPLFWFGFRFHQFYMYLLVCVQFYHG